MRRLLALTLLAAALALAALLSGARTEKGEKRTYKIVFDNSFGLVEGGDFRVGGVRAGKTTKFEVQKKKGRAAKAVVTAELSQPGFDDFRQDASCEILPQSLIGEYYVDCQPGSAPKKLPPDGRGVIPVERTQSTVPVDLVNNILRRPYRERFRLILTELGTALAGRPQDLQAVLRRAHPGLRETSRVLRILGDQNRIIERFIADSDTVVRELERNKSDVVRFIREAGDAAQITASRREQLRRSFNRLPTFLGELQPTMARLGELASEQTPLLADLRRASGDLNTFFARLGPFAEASRPALRSLGRAAVRGRRAFREGTQEVSVLKQVGAQARPTFRPLRQFLSTMDERRRGVENDPRAKAGSPPPPDPTAIPNAGGFTGFEAIWNYFFWQTLSINMVDQVGHILRAGVTVNDCSPFRNEPPRNDADRERFQRCKQYLGPSQPGITDLPGIDGSDPLANSGPGRDPPGGPDPSRPGERRGPGEARQRDISKPQITLPPAVQQLLDELPRAERRRAQERLREGQPPEGQTQLLDFLLGP